MTPESAAEMRKLRAENTETQACQRGLEVDVGFLCGGAGPQQQVIIDYIDRYKSACESKFESHRSFRGLHSLGKMESCRQQRTRGTRPNCVSVRFGWSPRSNMSTRRSGPRSNPWPTKLGIGTAQTLLNWIRRAQTDAGERPGVTSEMAAEMRKLRAENRELKRANEILKSTSVFFAAELDRNNK